MSSMVKRTWDISPGEFLAGWWNVLNGRTPLLSIEITRECPLKCPGCYAYGEDHLGAGAPTLREVSDFRGKALITGVLDLVRKYRPLHVSLVGGEPMVRRKELEQILPALGQMGVHTLLVTSAVIPIPKHWMAIPRLRVAVSVDGLPEHHDIRRNPATYERILRNIGGCTVNIHWTITRPMLGRAGYLEEYLRFWSSRDEANRIWASIYSPQVGERTPEMLGPEDRRALAEQLPRLKERYPKFLMNKGMAGALLKPPQTPRQCLFSKMSTNYTADLQTRVEPCVLGGQPDCSQCGCAASVGLHWVKSVKLAGPLRIEHLIRTSMAIGWAAVWLRRAGVVPSRWQLQSSRLGPHPKLVQISGLEVDGDWKERGAVPGAANPDG
jgi:MoaA/NifB/PqqE/SkfB family radical SAM enzyme